MSPCAALTVGCPTFPMCARAIRALVANSSFAERASITPSDSDFRTRKGLITRRAVDGVTQLNHGLRGRGHRAVRERRDPGFPIAVGRGQLQFFTGCVQPPGVAAHSRRDEDVLGHLGRFRCLVGSGKEVHRLPKEGNLLGAIGLRCRANLAH